MDQCPYCKSTEGYFVRTKITGYGNFKYNFDGTVHEENGELHDHLGYEELKFAYCIDCQKRLFKTENYMDEMLKKYGRKKK